jgi:cholesterol transport system auxiliary component
VTKASRFQTSLVAMCLAALAGCSSIGGSSNKALDTYDLAVPEVASKAKRNAKVQILIAEPQALKALDSENIVVRAEAASIQYLGGAQWGDRLPKLVQARLVQAFENSGRFGGVGRPGEGLAIDYQVMTDIRAFEIHTFGGDQALVEISVKLLNDRTGEVGSAKVFSATVPVGTGSNAFLRGLDGAFDKVAVEIVNWSAAKI